MIFEKVANYICDNNRGKATADERRQFEKELLDGAIIKDFDLLKETLTTLLADETAEAEELADELAGAYNTEFRICSKCGEIMFDGYIVFDNYYCSDECLHKDYSHEEYIKLYEEYEDDMNCHVFYTEWH